jgi:hypothetical protein
MPHIEDKSKDGKESLHIYTSTNSFFISGGSCVTGAENVEKLTAEYINATIEKFKTAKEAALKNAQARDDSFADMRKEFGRDSEEAKKAFANAATKFWKDKEEDLKKYLKNCLSFKGAIADAATRSLGELKTATSATQSASGQK